MMNLEAHILSIFLAVSSLVLLISLVMSGRKSRLQTRLMDLSGESQTAAGSDSMAQLAQSALPRMGTALLPEDEEKRTRLQARLLHAGLYGAQAMHTFLGVKLLLMTAPAVLGFAAGLLGLVPMRHGVVFGSLLGVVGLVGAGLWLDKRKANRQSSLRRALPDALDVLVLCLEGGLSLPGAIRRVASELRMAHPLLTAELNIVQREVQLGRSTGEALRQFGERADLHELRNLGSIILQSERLGASVVKALRVHAETLRQKRLQYAEEMAQKAAVKVLFPTLLLIFPGVFIVILAPAVFHILDLFRAMKH